MALVVVWALRLQAALLSFNPVFRLVALDGDVAYLRRLAAALRAKYPNLTVSLVNDRLP